MKRVLLLSHTTGYQLRAFNDAAEALGIELVFATDRCHRLDDPWQDRAVAVRFFDPDTSVAEIMRHARAYPIDGVIAVGDRPVILAARAAEALGIRWHSVAGAAATGDKRHSRTLLAAAGLPSPEFAVLFDRDIQPRASDFQPPASPFEYPVVLKPLGMSGSRGVIRANNEREFAEAFARIRALLMRPEVRAARTGLEDEILVERYIPGREFALEGAMRSGRLQVFALFDKPDPLEGPFFEETIYVTPSRLPDEEQRRLADNVERAARALGLADGPIHAECRLRPDGRIFVLEVAARPIGGLCSRVLSFRRPDDPRQVEMTRSLESVLLQHAVGESIASCAREDQAAAVMMIPIPRRGLYKGVAGQDAAHSVPGVTEIRITAKVDQLLEPLPEAGSYLGFIFARGATPADAERAVRAAHQRLSFDIVTPIALSTEH